MVSAAGGAGGGYLNSRQHDSDQVVVREQQGTDDAAVTHVFDDGCGEEREQSVKLFVEREASKSQVQG